MTDGTLHGFEADGTPVSVRARRLDVDDNGREFVEAAEPFIALGDGHLFVPCVPRWLHPRMFTFEPDQEATHG